MTLTLNEAIELVQNAVSTNVELDKHFGNRGRDYQAALEHAVECDNKLEEWLPAILSAMQQAQERNERQAGHILKSEQQNAKIIEMLRTTITTQAAEIATLNQLVRDKGYGQGEIDSVAADLQELDVLRQAVTTQAAEIEELKTQAVEKADTIFYQAAEVESYKEEIQRWYGKLQGADGRIAEQAAEIERLRAVVNAMSDCEILYGKDREPDPACGDPVAISMPTEDGYLWWMNEELAQAIIAHREAALAQASTKEVK